MNRTSAFQKAPLLLGDLEAHARTVQSPCGPGWSVYDGNARP
jgi:hypothetical protein